MHAPVILAAGEVQHRMRPLADLQVALEAHGVRCVPARNHRLVPRYNATPPEPSGLTDPALHIFTPGGTAIATTDGHIYTLPGGHASPVTDPAAAATAITLACPPAGQKPEMNEHADATTDP